VKELVLRNDGKFPYDFDITGKADDPIPVVHDKAKKGARGEILT
jgi:hypothetical protein